MSAECCPFCLSPDTVPDFEGTLELLYCRTCRTQYEPHVDAESELELVLAEPTLTDAERDDLRAEVSRLASRIHLLDLTLERTRYGMTPQVRANITAERDALEFDHWEMWRRLHALTPVADLAQTDLFREGVAA